MQIEKGYEKLVAVFQAAHDQAAHGKGKERHANGLPFHKQRMITIAQLANSDKGMVQQVVKKTLEGTEFTDHDRRENELLGAINYLAGIIIYHRLRQQPVENWPESAEKRALQLMQNGNDGAPYENKEIYGEPEAAAVPVTAGELRASKWYLAEVTQSSWNALESYGFKSYSGFVSKDIGLRNCGAPWAGFALNQNGEVARFAYGKDLSGLKQIHRRGSQFFWGPPL